MKNLSRDAHPSNPAAATFTIVHVPDDGPPHRLCKVINSLGVAEVADDLPYLCEYEEITVSTTEELLALLERLAPDPSRCILRARIKPDLAQPCRRLTSGDEATLDDVPCAWVLIDFDEIECPPDIDFCREPARAAEYVRGLLPAEFHNAACVWRASSNAGLKPGIRLHLWFLLGAELGTVQLEHWLRNVKCDKAVFRANQPHFTADPIFNGAPDPMSARRGTFDRAPRHA